MEIIVDLSRLSAEQTEWAWKTAARRSPSSLPFGSIWFWLDGPAAGPFQRGAEDITIDPKAHLTSWPECERVAS